MTLTVRSHQAETSKGVPINLESCAQVKIQTSFEGGGAGSLSEISVAAQNFMGKRNDEIRDSLTRTLEGHQRQIIGSLTVEELYKDRSAFAAKVREHVIEDLHNLGFQLCSYTVTGLDDTLGYMLALGATQAALVKREADEGRARHEAEARKSVAHSTSDGDIATAEAAQTAHLRINSAMSNEASSDRDLQLKQAQFQKEINTANSEAEAAGQISRAKQNQALVREQTQQQVERAEVMLQVTDLEMEKAKKLASGDSMAELIAKRNQGEATKVIALAEADRIKLIGAASADAVRKAGEAEAEVLRRKAETYKEFGEAAIVQSVITQLPEIARAITEPLNNVEKMVFISSDAGSANKLSGDAIRLMGELPDAVQSLTGMDLTKALRRLEGK